MKRSLVFIALATLGLGLWVRDIARQEEALRASRSRVGHLLTQEERARIPLAALRIEMGGKSLLYGRFDGMWRCREYHLAPVDTQALESLYQKLTEAEGMVHTDDTEEAPIYGINTPETIRVSLCGRKVLEDPSGDVLFAFDVGKEIPGRDGAFVRRRGTKEIWGIDANPRVELAQAVAPGLPPLLEKGVLPRSWPGWERQPHRIFVDRPATGYELQRRLADLDPSELEPGQVPWRWYLDPGAKEKETAPGPSQAFSFFLQQVPYVAVLPRERLPEMELEEPRAVLTLAAPECEPIEARIGRTRSDGTAPVWVPFTNTLYLVTDEVAELLAPSKSLFAPGSQENPWDGYLRQASGTQPR